MVSTGGWAALNYFGARYLHGPTGRFTSVDPIVDVDRATRTPQRWNLYTYVENSPLRYIDPDAVICKYAGDDKTIEKMKAMILRLYETSETFRSEVDAVQRLGSEFVVVIRDRGLRQNEQKSSDDVESALFANGTQRHNFYIDAHGRTADDVVAHEMGHANDAHTNTKQYYADSLKTKEAYERRRPIPHEQRPEEQRADRFEDRVMKEVRDSKRNRRE